MKILNKIYTYFFAFLLFNLLAFNTAMAAINNSEVDNITPLIEQNNSYNANWFYKLHYAWQLKSFADNSDIGLADAAIINLALGDVELYLTKLTDLVGHINNAFSNNPNFAKFNSDNGKANNLFNFLAYLKTLKKSDASAENNLLKSEFNMYEIVSINRLLEVDLANKVATAKTIMANYNFTDDSIEQMASDYDVLYIQELNNVKKDRAQDFYTTCIARVNTKNNLISGIANCNKQYGNNDNEYIGIRACYLGGIENFKSEVQNITDINNLTTKLNKDCAVFVNPYLQKNKEKIMALQKSLAFLINFYLTNNLNN